MVVFGWCVLIGGWVCEVGGVGILRVGYFGVFVWVVCVVVDDNDVCWMG